MAVIIGSMDLKITPHPTDIGLLNFAVTYTIAFTAFDIKTDLPYRKVYTLIGVDTPAILTGPPPDPIIAGGNDTLVTVIFGNVSSGGVANKTLTDIISVSRATADEDKPPIPNPDELQMRVELQPLLPVSTARNSPIVKIDLP